MSQMPTKGTFVLLHMVKSFPFSVPVRGMDGQQKSCEFGGSTRCRMSSQSIKYAIRHDWKNRMDGEKLRDFFGIRTNRIYDHLCSKLGDAKLARAVVKAIYDSKFDPKKKKDAKEGQSDYLIFTSDKEIDQVVDIVKEHQVVEKDEKAAKAAMKAMKVALKSAKIGMTVDVALFGRMQANAKDFDVYAASQFSHAISVSPMAGEFDEFTAVDDLKAEDENADSGAAHLNTTSANSACYYQYASISFDKLVESLGDDKELAVDAISELIASFALSCPSGKMNSFAHRTLPDYLSVEIRESQPFSLVNAFESPVRGGNKGIVSGAIRRLLDYRQKLEDAYGDEIKSDKSFVIHTSDLDKKTLSLTAVQKAVVKALLGE